MAEDNNDEIFFEIDKVLKIVNTGWTRNSENSDTLMVRFLLVFQIFLPQVFHIYE